MSEYITAEQARINAAEAQSLTGAYKRAETEEICALILKASQQGLNNVYVGYSDAVIASRLKALGYTVKVMSDQRDGDCMTITW